MLELKQIKTVGIIGGGTMGIGIAQVCALAGYHTIINDVSENALQNAINQLELNLTKGVEKGKIKTVEKNKAMDLVSTTSSISDVKCDLAVEAVLENLDIKRNIFKELEANNSTNSILTSNTSSIPITQIAEDCKNPERIAGMHFFNPAHIMKLVEIISGESTDPGVAQIVYEFVKLIGKTPVMAKDSPGFIVNRVARHYYVESLKILEDGVASHETIDKLMEASGFKMGPFRLMDLIGVDTNYSVTESMYNSFNQDPKFRPSRIQKQKVDTGQLGKKSGKGFYDYS